MRAVAFIASLIQRKDRHLLRLFSSIFSNYFILDRGFQCFHPIKVPICGLSLLTPLSAGFVEKMPHEGYLKKVDDRQPVDMCHLFMFPHCQ
jgi:hypothetical protein